MTANQYDALSLKYGKQNACSNLTRFRDFVEYHTSEITRMTGYLGNNLSRRKVTKTPCACR